MRALILVDLQNDFVPGGALAVADGDLVIPIANCVVEKFELVVATQDWHPKNHASFAANHPGKNVGDVIELDGLQQILWPVHCVQNTAGADFVTQLNRERITKIFHKGTDPRIDSYSGFFDNGHRKATGLGDFLHEKNVHEVYVMGLATEYCVKFTALDARQLGFETNLIEDGCRGVNIRTDDSVRAIDQMQAAGVRIIQSSDV